MAVIQAHVTLRALRTSRGLTSVALAEKIRERGVKVDPDHILAVELGHRRAGLSLRVAWADELGISPNDIHFETELRDLIALADADSEDAKKAA
jgi:transcriptional regulator with XRE-family HTH domain